MSNYALFHWGLYEVDQDPAGSMSLRPWREDARPSLIGLDQPGPLAKGSRIARPCVRETYLRGNRDTGALRGREPFIEVEWDEAFALVANELNKVVANHGNNAIFGGSYGWASAGRFHHAPGQLHRFLNCVGGYVRHVGSYSHAAATAVLPHLIDRYDDRILSNHTSLSVLAETTDLFVAFGGLPLKNAQMSAGGAIRHDFQASLNAMQARGARFINISPARNDLDGADCEWIPIRPGSDAALMLGLAHSLIASDAHDSAFLARYCVGFEVVRAYLFGEADGTVRDARWASSITGVPEARIRHLAEELVSCRSMVNASWSIQRVENGEQSLWTLVTLASLIGQIGLPGGGFGVGYGTMNSVGAPGRRLARSPTLPQRQNPVKTFIPVARITDMLNRPGELFSYDGGTYAYPDIRLVYWAGGNPFHHHQDLNTLEMAWQRPETIVVHEQYWTATARRADIVLPITTSLERNDIGYAGGEGHLVAMKAHAVPHAEARNDFDVFAGVARALGIEQKFTEGRNETAWLKSLYDEMTQGNPGIEFPPFDEFWASGLFSVGDETAPKIMLAEFRADPDVCPLPTPSGRIELFSPTVAAFGYAECPGHAAWNDPVEALGRPLAARFPLHLLSNQPKQRLHSQLDHSDPSRAAKLHGREPVSMNPADAAARGIVDGDLVRIFNDRGQCISAARLTHDLAEGVAILSTGAWFDPVLDGPQAGLEKHGNPNVLTSDRPTSRLAQGSTAHSCLVEIERYVGDPPAVTAFNPPPVIQRGLCP